MELNISTNPGCSWISVDGAVHDFVVEDDRHLSARKFKPMLEEMAEELRTTSYVSDKLDIQHKHLFSCQNFVKLILRDFLVRFVL